MTLQDEEENQIQTIMFNADITHFEDLFDPFHTYLVSVAQVKESSYLYGNPLNKFTWTIDRSTIVEPIEKVTPQDPLPPPTRLTIIAFDTFEYQPKESEFDILAIVINGGPSTYAANGRRIQEFIVMDKQAKTIEPMLNAYKVKSTSSTSYVMVVLFEDEIIAISNIQAQPQGQVFYVVAELSLPNENQRFCVLSCSDCKQLFTRSFSRRTIYCTNCQRSTHRIPSHC
nr:uncharacterized protein LOC104104400 [Nicotiana tomentosiformis]